MPDKTSAVLNIKLPTNVKEAKSALGIMGYVSSKIPMYSEVVRHINKLRRKNVPFMWDQKYQDSLNLAKEVLTNPPVLIYLDPNEKYHLFTEASNYTWSAALTQERKRKTFLAHSISKWHLSRVRSELGSISKRSSGHT